MIPDLNDTLQEDGPEAVRSRLDGASPHKRQPAEKNPPNPANPPCPPSGPSSGRVRIELKKGQQPRIVDEALALLQARGDIFERAQEMVRVTGSKVEAVSDEWLVDYLGRAAEFIGQRRAGESFVEEARDVPTWLARRIMAKSGERGLTELRAVISAPTLRPDGSLLNTPGYDQPTGLLLRPGLWPNVPANPGKLQMQAAAKALWHPFKDFPFVEGGVAGGVMLSCLLTVPVRSMLPTAPAFSFDAPDAGTGKTLLGKAVQALAGMEAEVMPEVRDEEEMRKRLLASLRDGQPAILLDNIQGSFKSPSMEALLTSPIYTDRVLGMSRMLRLPTATMVLFSGNNFRPAGDLYRRTLTARMNAECEEPELRSFDLDPYRYCTENRQDMIAAALTLLRGFIAAGSPPSTNSRMASFEDWDARIRQAVIWLQRQELLPMVIEDPAKQISRAKADDPERQRLDGLLELTQKLKGPDRWLAAEIVALAETPSTEDCKALQVLLMDIGGERGHLPTSKSLGRWLERQVDKRVNGRWIVNDGKRSGTKLWRVRTTGGYQEGFAGL